MQWLTFDQAITQGFKVCGNPPQYLDIPADRDALSAEIPTEAHFEEEGIGPGPSLQWYAWIGDRPLIVERTTVDTRDSVCLYTNYQPRQDKSGDWTVLPELSELPGSIRYMRPHFILSRTASPKYVLYRPDPAGWSGVVYNASSLQEAEELLAFLRKDTFNESCYIGSSEPEGLWSAIRNENGQQEILCSYSSRNAALSFACNLSTRFPSSVLLVKDRLNASSKHYVVSSGRVVDSID